jgi:hypothetical protein
MKMDPAPSSLAQAALEIEISTMARLLAHTLS